MEFISSFWHLAKLIFASTMLFLQQINVVLLGAATKELIESFFGLFSSGDLVYSLEEKQRRLLNFILYLLHQAKHSPSLTVQSRVETALLSEAVAGRAICA